MFFPYWMQKKSAEMSMSLERLSEQFSELQAAFRTIFKVMGGYLKAERISLKVVSGRIFRIAKCFPKTKPNIISSTIKHPKNFQTITARTERVLI
jgi:hypothetical protein